MSSSTSSSTLAAGAPVARQPARVVIDASVVVSALIFGGGEPAALRRAWQKRKFMPLLCLETLSDLEGQLSTPQLGLTDHERWRLLHEYVPYAKLIEMPRSGLVRRGSLQTPAAVNYSRLAMVGRARAWVTADLEVLGLCSDALCPRYSVDAFVNMLYHRRRPETRLQVGVCATN